MSLDYRPAFGTILRMKPTAQQPAGLIPFKNMHAVYLCERMRDDERAELLAFTGAKAYDAEVAARGFMSTPGLKFTLLGPDGYPDAAGGVEEVRAGVWQAWMVGSVLGWSRSWRSMTKACRWLADGLFEGGARRLQVHALSSRTLAARWYASCGLKHEGTMRGYGAGGEDVSIFARLAEG